MMPHGSDYGVDASHHRQIAEILKAPSQNEWAAARRS
jgi:hypothetical protein